MSSALQKWLSLGWSHTFQALCLFLQWKSPCLGAIKNNKLSFLRFLSPPTRGHRVLYFCSHPIFILRFVETLTTIKSIRSIATLFLQVSGIKPKTFPRSLLLYTSPYSCWHFFLQTYFFTPHHIPGGTIAVTSITKAEPFLEALSGNSTLEDSGHIHLSHFPCSTIPDIKILYNDVFNAL